MCIDRFCVRTEPFYSQALSILRFCHLSGSWYQSVMNSKGQLYWEFHFPNPSEIVTDSTTKKKNPWMQKCSVHIFIQCSVLLVSGSEKKCSLCVEEVFKAPRLVYLFKAEFGGQADGEHCICQSQVIGPPSLLRRHFLKPSILGFLWAFCHHVAKMFLSITSSSKVPWSTLLVSLVKKLRPTEIALPPAFPSVYNYSHPCPEFNAKKQAKPIPVSRAP